jgi:hypothetical protein
MMMHYVSSIPCLSADGKPVGAIFVRAWHHGSGFELARDIIAKAAANKSLAEVHKRISNFFAYKDQPCTKTATKRLRWLWPRPSRS